MIAAAFAKKMRLSELADELPAANAVAATATSATSAAMRMDL
jgi:hypothetical protein